MAKHWTDNWGELTEKKKLDTLSKVCQLETTNSVTKDDLLTMLKWLKERYDRMRTKAKKPEAPCWVSVQDKLPPSGVRVLTWDGAIVAANTYYENSGSFLLLPQNGQITHWMPMPMAPVETITYPQVDGITPTVIKEEE